MKKILLLLLPAVLILSACSYVAGKKVKGNGTVKTETRSVESFNGVSTSGSFDIIVNSGAQEVKVEAEENLQSYIETYVDGDGILKVRTKDGYRVRPTRDVRIYVTAPSFRKLHSSGSGNIKGQSKITSADKIEISVTGSADMDLDVDAPEVESEITGSGNADLRGNTKIFESKISGSGSVRALDLKAEETTVKVSGSGDVEVFASVKLTVRVSGSGDVRYKGSPTVDSKITGGGGVKKLD